MHPTVGPAPQARREPAVIELHGEQRVDDYTWMHHDREALVDYLVEERRYYDSHMSHLADLRQALYDEMARRLAPTHRSVSWSHGSWLYYSQTSSGKQYEDFCRRPASGGDEHVLLSGNDLAQGHEYFALGIRELSPDDRLLAYSVDTTGDEVYELRVRDLESGHDLPDRIPRSSYGFAWAADASQFLYAVQDDANRPYRVLLHRLGSDPGADELVFEEPDQRFEVNVAASRSGELAFVTVGSRDTSEVWLCTTADLAVPPRVVEPRRRGIEYAVDHHAGTDGGDLVVVTNDGAEEFRVMTAPVKDPGLSNWEELAPAATGERHLAVDAYTGHVVVSLRHDGRPWLRILDLAGGEPRDVAAPDAASTITLASRDAEHPKVHDPYDSESVTVVTESLIAPPSWWAVELATGRRTLLQREEVHGYDETKYLTERLTATAHDGVEIPVTIARPNPPAADPAPMLLYGYGSYEACIDPYFDLTTASLLDHGVSFAIAHVRGGGEHGRMWWQQGRLHTKPTTFEDFVAVADMLAGQDWADERRIASRGLSAGGLLQGAAFSQAPARWRAVVAEVPFVDVVTTMLDASAPLTVTEWDEWGDPRDPEDYAVMRGYSPYENIPAGTWPDLLVTGSLHDARVMIREPAKWVARLRAAAQTDSSRILFRPELGPAAHIGASGRLDRLRYESEIIAFLLDVFTK